MQFMFHDRQTVAAQAIGVTVADIITLAIGKIKAVTLALQDITHFAFKRFAATRAMFIFMMCHKHRNKGRLLTALKDDQLN